MTQEKKEELVKEFARNNLLLTAHGFERMIEDGLDSGKVIKVAKEKRQWLVSNEFLMEYVEVEGERHTYAPPPPPAIRIEEPARVPELLASLTVLDEPVNTICPSPPRVQEEVVVVPKARSIPAKEFESRLDISRDSDVSEKSTCEGKIEDFVDYFNEKYASMRDIIRKRENYLGAVPVEVLKKYKGEVSSIVAMVKEKRESKKGYKFLEVEDSTGEITVLIPQNNDALCRLYGTIVEDEVIGIQGKLTNELLIASDIVEPELPVNHKAHYAEEPVYAAFLSDMHVGSNLFLEKEFASFLSWLNLKGGNGDIADKIKYILVAGDLVDGIGVYPSQEKELAIPDIYRQYDYLARLLEGVPDYIEIVLTVGNHDAVRGAEPQPVLPKDIGGPLYELDNVHLAGNPVSVSVHGVKVLMYHGTSFDTLIGKIPGCSYAKPETAMTECLKKRHLVPMYKEDPISPERKDYLAIKEEPDVFHAGHVHTNGYASYRGVKIINSGTWQARTKYQEELGHIPTPGRVPLMNLQNHEISVKHFVE